MYKTFLINYEADDGDGPVFEDDGQNIYISGKKVGRESDIHPGREQAQFNANHSWELANKLCWVLNGWGEKVKIKNAYIGVVSQGVEESIPFLRKINFLTEEDRASGDKYKSELYESAKEEFKLWPNCLSYVALVLELNPVNPSLEDQVFLSISHFSDLSFVAPVFCEKVKGFVTQSYERGEYDEGYFSNDEDDSYKLSSEQNALIKKLQDTKFIKALIG